MTPELIATRAAVLWLLIRRLLEPARIGFAVCADSAADAAFEVRRRRLQRIGVGLHRTDPRDGPVTTYFVKHAGLIRAAHSLDSVDRIAGPIYEARRLQRTAAHERRQQRQASDGGPT